MNESGKIRDCDTARDAIQERLDGPVSAELASSLEDHLTSCDSCRDFARDMAEICDTLRTTPDIELPQSALEVVWQRTIHQDESGDGDAGWFRRIGLAVASAAAAVLVAAMLLMPSSQTESRAELTPELLRAANDLQTALALTNQALERSERATVDTVLREQVAPSLKRFPVLRAPALSGASAAESATGDKSP